MNYLVVGTGKSGVAAARLLMEKKQNVVILDGNESLDKDEFYAKNPDLKDICLELGDISCERKEWVDTLVLSPGVPTDLPWVNELRDRGVEISGEIELGFSFGKGKVLAITGTNGKTTTTTLVGDIMKAHFAKVFVVGNIGIPYTEMALSQDEESITVAEISSFQLETVKTFHPVVSAILNVTPDHLNRHHTMENYIKAKEEIAAHQTEEEFCVLNYDSEATRDFGKRCKAKVIYFSSKECIKSGFFYRDGQIFRAKAGNEEKIMNITDMNLVGMCNVENVMAALAIAESAGVPLETSLSVIKGFKAVEHRIEFTATKRGVDYYNDSKGTNPDAAIQGIKAMVKPTILIGGGYDKGSEYDEWIEAFEGKVKLLVLIGQTREKIAECARKHGINNIVMADTFEECMNICIENACPGDAVLLSPACASWGMFPNYEERGRIFKDIVRSIEE